MKKAKGKRMTYAGSGVNYDVMDALKRRGLELAGQTFSNFDKLGPRFGKMSIVKKSIGESATVYDDGTNDYVAHVVEGLGTKNMVAEVMEEKLKVVQLFLELSGKKPTSESGAVGMTIANLYSGLGQCAAAMIINDLITVGAQPIGLNMYLAARDAEWFRNIPRWEAILQGWKNACDLAGCVWGGGETPTLRGIIEKGTCELSGSGWGKIPGKNMLHGSRIQAGDKIILYESSGIHANGLTMTRDIAEILPHGFFTKLPSGRTFGKALLTPTHIYSRALNYALDAHAGIHYAINITGHGWRKLMRANEKFQYIIEKVPEPQEEFRFIMEKGPVDEREAYSNLNMGAGFAVITNPHRTNIVLDAAERAGIGASVAGVVKEAKKKSVVIMRQGKRPIVFKEKEMKIR
jgi:phosphoribosylformylglycinamidine cyclo-ligase